MYKDNIFRFATLFFFSFVFIFFWHGGVCFCFYIDVGIYFLVYRDEITLLSAGILSEAMLGNVQFLALTMYRLKDLNSTVAKNGGQCLLDY